MTQRIKAYVFNTKETKYLSCPFTSAAARVLARKPTHPPKRFHQAIKTVNWFFQPSQKFANARSPLFISVMPTHLGTPILFLKAVPNIRT